MKSLKKGIISQVMRCKGLLERQFHTFCGFKWLFDEILNVKLLVKSDADLFGESSGMG